jgi:uncharacterized protein
MLRSRLEAKIAAMSLLKPALLRSADITAADQFVPENMVNARDPMGQPPPTGVPTWPPRWARLNRRNFLRGAGLVGLSGAGVAGYATAVEPERLVTTTYRITPPGWRSGGLRIAAVADIHAGGPNMALEHIRRIVDETNALAPDLVVLLGDFVADHRFVIPVPTDVWAGELSRLGAPLGVWAILGNHDWWHNLVEVRAALGKIGIPLLENRSVLLGEGSGRFWLAGLGDQIAHRLGRGAFRGEDDLAGTLAQVTTDDPVILLAHEPDIFPRVPARVSLTLAGHTHGGQIRIPMVWEHLVPSRYGARYAYGHIVETGRHMIVSGGLGTSIVPVRLGVPPEIVQLEIGNS